MMLKGYTQRGFSLIEILVGMTLALLGILVCLQVLIVSQSDKKTTVSSGDTQQNGAMALYDIQNSIANAGYGIAAALFDPVNSCTNTAGQYTAAAGYHEGVPAGFNFNFWLAPVVIHNGTPQGTPDTITVFQGNTSGSVSTTDVAAATASTITVSAGSTFNFNLGDVFLAYQAGRGCMVGQITASDGTSVLSFTSGGVYLSPYTGKNEQSLYNKAGGITDPVDANMYQFTNGAKLVDLGPYPNLTMYSAINGALQARSSLIFNGSNETVADGIVNLQAQYGIDTNGDGAVDQYVDAPNNVLPLPTLPDTNADGVLNQLDWLNVRAIRVAILARGVERNPACDSAQPSWSGGNFYMNGNANNNGVANWKCYKYRVFETTIPLRNLAWNPT